MFQNININKTQFIFYYSGRSHRIGRKWSLINFTNIILMKNLIRQQLRPSRIEQIKSYKNISLHI